MIASTKFVPGPFEFMHWRCEVPYQRPQYDEDGVRLKGKEAWGTVTWLLGFGSTKNRAEQMAAQTLKRHRITTMDDVRSLSGSLGNQLEGDNRGAQPTGTAGNVLDPGAS